MLSCFFWRAFHKTYVLKLTILHGRWVGKKWKNVSYCLCAHKILSFLSLSLSTCNTVTISSLLTHWSIPDIAAGWPLPVTQKCLSKNQWTIFQIFHRWKTRATVGEVSSFILSLTLSKIQAILHHPNVKYRDFRHLISQVQIPQEQPRKTACLNSYNRSCKCTERSKLLPLLKLHPSWACARSAVGHPYFRPTCGSHGHLEAVVNPPSTSALAGML